MFFFIFFDFFSILLLSSLDDRDQKDDDDDDLLLDLSLLMGGLLSYLGSVEVTVGALTSSEETYVTSAWGFGASTFGAAGLTSPQLAITTLLKGLSPGWVGSFSILSQIS